MNKFWEEFNRAICMVMLCFALIGILGLEHIWHAGLTRLFMWLVLG